MSELESEYLLKDTSLKIQPKKTIALFGSCNKQTAPQNYWTTFSLYKPSYFFWTGDAVYSKTYNVESLAQSFEKQKKDKEYQSFIHNNHVQVDGVWDDHDFGVNDGGGKREGEERLKQRKDIFVDFMQESGNMEFKEKVSQNQGLFHSTTLFLDSNSNLSSNSTNSTTEVKFIYLDTRSFRDDYYIPSIGQIKMPFFALIASGIRGLYSVLGWGRTYEGQLLGEEQWNWLEKTLKESTSDFHVLVSSIQILTTNPVVESWGHYPVERSRFLDLLVQTDPNGVILISGDVHYSEISSIKYKRKSGEKGKWIEMTSSGLTHSCSTSTVTKYLCPRMLRMFRNHRDHRNSFYMGKNFGSIEFNTEEYYNKNESMISFSKLNSTKKLTRKRLHFNIHDMEKSKFDYMTKSILKWSVTSSDLINQLKVNDPIINYEIKDFVVMPPFFRLSFYMLVCSFLFLIFSKLFLNRKMKNE